MWISVHVCERERKKDSARLSCHFCEICVYVDECVHMCERESERKDSARLSCHFVYVAQ